jgi:hypothetical protein
MVEYYEEADEYLDTLADDIPLFTNTREGVYSEGASHAPAPLETNSDLFVNPMRAQFASMRASRAKPAAPAAGGVASRAALYEGGGGVPPIAYQSAKTAVLSPESEGGFEIPGLQDGIADLQMDDDDDDNVEEEEEAFEDIPMVAPSRSKENSPMLAPQNKSSSSPASDKSPGLPDKMMTELAFANSETRDVSPHVIQGLVQIMRDGVHDKRKKATIAMCNLCCESQQNRTYAGDADAVPVLILMMQDSNPDQHLQVCVCVCVWETKQSDSESVTFSYL